MLSISCDVYHQRNIPFERVENAILAAQECQIPYTVAVCTDNYGDSEYQLLLERLAAITRPDAILTAITFPAGKGTQISRFFSNTRRLIHRPFLPVLREVLPSSFLTVELLPVSVR
jgi:hypothetical protein